MINKKKAKKKIEIACLYFVAFIALSIYLLAASPAFMRYYTGKLSASKSPAFRWNHDKYGDLYNLSFLKDFKDETKSLIEKIQRVESLPKETDLYIIGDSYLAEINAAAVDTGFYHTALGYYYYPLKEGYIPKTISFEKNGHKKILLFERTERFLMTEMPDKAKLKQYGDFLRIAPVDTMAVKESHREPDKNLSAATIPGNTESIRKKFQENIKTNFNVSVMNQNLETLLYGYGLFDPVKEYKAGLNYHLFKRVNSAVIAAPDGYNLYLNETVAPENRASSFLYITDNQVDSIVSGLHSIGEIYKAKGFDEVVFSFIPNAVTIGDPQLGVYNNLIQRIEGKLKFPYIDIYTPFKNHPNGKLLYRRSDTHWNAKGYAFWADQVNNWLRRQPIVK